MPTERDKWIDALKAAAILGVVGIHLLGGLEQIDRARVYWGSFLTIDQFFRFCVPLFVAVSGYTLARSYRERQLKIGEFYFRRAKRILPLYFFWSGIIILISLLYPAWSVFNQNLTLWQILVLGRASYQLYFVPMIFQLYLVFPVILHLSRKLGLFFIGVVFVSEVWWFHYLSEYFSLGKTTAFLASDQGQYVVFVSWLFYFVLGVSLAVGKRVWKPEWDRVFKVASVLVAMGALWWLVTEARGNFSQGADLLAATRFTRLPVLIYGSAVFVMIYAWRDGITRMVDKLGRVGQAVVAVGRESFLIYLAHTTVLALGFSFLAGMPLVPIVVGSGILATAAVLSLRRPLRSES